MAMELVDCPLCKKDRMTKLQMHRYGSLVDRLCRIGMVAGLSLVAIGIYGFLGIRQLEPESTLLLATTFGVALCLMILGAIGTSRRSVMWCKTCGAVSAAAIDVN